jgi:predicted small integral membrane protein
MAAQHKNDDKLTPADPAREQIAALTDDETPIPQQRRGFLPFDANAFDRVFISIVCLVAIHLLWFRFLETSLSINIATVISLILAFVIIRWG